MVSVAHHRQDVFGVNGLHADILTATGRGLDIEDIETGAAVSPLVEDQRVSPLRAIENGGFGAEKRQGGLSQRRGYVQWAAIVGDEEGHALHYSEQLAEACFPGQI